MKDVLKHVSTMSDKMTKIEENQSVHTGITCDNCKKPTIIGVRYKCFICPNYDLCSDCEKTNCHDIQHCFIKLKDPSTMTQIMAQSIPCDVGSILELKKNAILQT